MTDQEVTTETAEERAEAHRRQEQFNRALARGMASWNPQTGGPEVVIFDPLHIMDPKHAKAEATDSRLWQRLLTEAAVADMEADEDPAGGLYWQLMCVRTHGAELEPYAPKGWKPGQPLEWRIIAGPEYLGGPDRYKEDREAWLLPFAERLTPLLRRMKLYARREAPVTGG